MTLDKKLQHPATDLPAPTRLTQVFNNLFQRGKGQSSSRVGNTTYKVFDISIIGTVTLICTGILKQKYQRKF